MVRLIHCIVSLVCVAATIQMTGLQQQATADDPGRVRVRQTIQGRTVVGSQGELLRGAVVSVFKFRRDQIGTEFGPSIDYATDPAHWDRMKANGVNAVRLVWFDPWQRSHGDPSVDPNRPFPFMPITVSDVYVQGLVPEGSQSAAKAILRDERKKLFSDFDTIVDLAAERGMYVMINYHDVFGYTDPNFKKGLGPDDFQFPFKKKSRRYLRTFWRWMSQRYGDRTHVLFELMNEPVGFHPNDYTVDDVDQIALLYHEVRSRAPQTHLVLGSFVTAAHFGDRSMLQIATELEQSGVDFGNASIAYHGYDISPDLDHDPAYVTDVTSRFAVINSEQNFPADVDDGTDDPDAPGYFGDELGFQSMERLNVSWFSWNTSGPDEFGANYECIIRPDAKRKAYDWDFELSFADWLNELESARGFFSRFLHAIFSRIFLRWTYF